MFTFLKKIFGLPTDAEVAAAKAPYKVETPVVESVPTAVNNQVTDSVTEVAPAKKPRKPRTPKVKVEEKAAKPVKAAAMKTTKRSKKA